MEILKPEQGRGLSKNRREGKHWKLGDGQPELQAACWRPGIIRPERARESASKREREALASLPLCIQVVKGPAGGLPIHRSP
jgi:hypothetical protein